MGVMRARRWQLHLGSGELSLEGKAVLGIVFLLSFACFENEHSLKDSGHSQVFFLSPWPFPRFHEKVKAGRDNRRVGVTL